MVEQLGKDRSGVHHVQVWLAMVWMVGRYPKILTNTGNAAEEG